MGSCPLTHFTSEWRKPDILRDCALGCADAEVQLHTMQAMPTLGRRRAKWILTLGHQPNRPPTTPKPRTPLLLNFSSIFVLYEHPSRVFFVFYGTLVSTYGTDILLVRS